MYTATRIVDYYDRTTYCKTTVLQCEQMSRLFYFVGSCLYFRNTSTIRRLIQKLPRLPSLDAKDGVCVRARAGARMCVRVCVCTRLGRKSTRKSRLLRRYEGTIKARLRRFGCTGCLILEIGYAVSLAAFGKLDLVIESSVLLRHHHPRPEPNSSCISAYFGACEATCS